MLTVFGTMDYIVFGVGAVFLAFWLLLFFLGLKHASLFDSLSEKEFPLKEIYFVGFAALQLVGYRYKSSFDRKLRKALSVLYDEKYSEYYLRVVHAQQITISLSLLVLGFALYGLADDILVLGVMLMFAGLAYYYFGTLSQKRIEKRAEEMLRDFSDVVSKLALLTNAGMILREAWTEIAYTGETSIYKEMQRSVSEMNNGASEIDAIFRFGKRCIIPEIKKFASTIVQGLVKGNSELTVMLQAQSKEVWGLKKQDVRRQGEKAASKLMIPLMIMFVGILIMVIVPIFTNLGV